MYEVHLYAQNPEILQRRYINDMASKINENTEFVPHLVEPNKKNIKAPNNWLFMRGIRHWRGGFSLHKIPYRNRMG